MKGKAEGTVRGKALTPAGPSWRVQRGARGPSGEGVRHALGGGRKARAQKIQKHTPGLDMNPGSIERHSQFQRPVVKQPLRPAWGMGLEGWQERERLGQGSRCQVLETWSSGRKEGQRPDKRRWGARRFPHRSLCRSTKAPVTGVLARATAGGCARGSTHSQGLDALPPPAALERVPAPARTCPRFLQPSTPAEIGRAHV